MLAVNAAVLIGVFWHKIALPPYVPYIHLLVDYHFGFTKRALIGAIGAVAAVIENFPADADFFTNSINLNAKLRVDTWRDSHYSWQIPHLPKNISRLTLFTYAAWMMLA